MQVGRRPRPEVPPEYREYDPRKESKWKPALQRIRLGMFSRKDNTRSAKVSRDPSLPLNKVYEQRLNAKTYPSRDGRAARNPFTKYFRKGSQVAPPPELSHSPPESKDSKAYNFFKRTLTKSRGQNRRTNNEHIHTQQHRRRHTDLARPVSTAYVPTGKPVEHEPLLQRPSTAAYIPQHAATDFKRMSNYGTNFEGYSSLDQQLKRASIDPSHFTTPNSAAFDSYDEDADFQKFLAQSRAEAARALESSHLRASNKIMPSEAERIMGEIEANYRAATRDFLQPSTSASKRLSRSGSFLEKVGDYYKPVETVSRKDGDSGAATTDQAVPIARRTSRRSNIARPVSRGESFMIAVGEYIKPPDFQPGGTNNPRTGPLLTAANAERQAKRRSRMSEASRRSVSQERDSEEDGRAARASWISTGTFGRQRSSTMPTSPGLDRYNRAVRKGGY